jgi:hypothetical protein
MQQIAPFLHTMGSTSDQIAQKLAEAGITGLRDSTSFLNPVIRYVNQHLVVGGKLEIGAAGDTFRLFLGGKLQEIPLPAAMREFLARFHQGDYPQIELIKDIA